VGGSCQLAFHVQPGSYDTDTLIGVLKQLRTLLGGQKATLLWDGPPHRSNQMRAFIASHRDWLVVERLPAYAPDVNPVEGLWANLKDVELANLTVATIGRWSSTPTAGSSGCGRRRTWRTRSCAAPACRSPRLVNLSTQLPRPVNPPAVVRDLAGECRAAGQGGHR
jgi:hypothetical protein